MEIVNEIKKELKSFNNKKKELVEKLRTEFPILLKPLFDKSKKINSISWHQYTPYFNDGDTCKFGVIISDCLDINGEYGDDVEWFGGWKLKLYLEKGEYKKEIENDPNIDIEESKIIFEFEDVLSSIPDEFYEDLFGDHVKVTIHNNGKIDVEEYDHE